MFVPCGSVAQNDPFTVKSEIIVFCRMFIGSSLVILPVHQLTRTAVAVHFIAMDVS